MCEITLETPGLVRLGEQSALFQYSASELEFIDENDMPEEMIYDEAWPGILSRLFGPSRCLSWCDRSTSWFGVSAELFHQMLAHEEDQRVRWGETLQEYDEQARDAKRLGRLPRRILNFFLGSRDYHVRPEIPVMELPHTSFGWHDDPIDINTLLRNLCWMAEVGIVQIQLTSGTEVSPSYVRYHNPKELIFFPTPLLIDIYTTWGTEDELQLENLLRLLVRCGPPDFFFDYENGRILVPVNQ